MRKTFLLIFLCVLGVLSTSLTVSSCSSKDDEEENKSDSQSAYKDSIRKDSIYRDSIRKVSIYRDSLHKDSLSILEKVLSSTTTSITVKKGDVVAFYNAKNNLKGLFTVTTAGSTNESITLLIDTRSFILSDAGTSYLAYDKGYVAQQINDFENDASKVILAKRWGEVLVISGTESGASERRGAGVTVFLKK